MSSPTLSMIKYIINRYYHTCRVNVCGLELIFDLLLQTFLSIQRIGANSYPTNYRIFHIVKGMVDLHLKCDFFQIPLWFFYWVYFIAYFYLHIFHRIDRIKKNSSSLMLNKYLLLMDRKLCKLMVWSWDQIPEFSFW